MSDNKGKSMNKDIKKTVAIQAIEWTGENERQMSNFLNGEDSGILKVEGDHHYIDHFMHEGGLVIKTLDGDRRADVGDMIVKSKNGEFHTCKPSALGLTDPTDKEYLESLS